MKGKFLILGLCLAIHPAMTEAKQSTKKNKQADRELRKNEVPTWGAAHNYQNDKYVYFPDYQTFYSPDRGYIYQQNNNWITSPNVPSNMSAIDMNNARLQQLNVPLNAFPERNFSTYQSQYPSQPAPASSPLIPAPQSR